LVVKQATAGPMKAEGKTETGKEGKRGKGEEGKRVTGKG